MTRGVQNDVLGSSFNSFLLALIFEPLLALNKFSTVF